MGHNRRYFAGKVWSCIVSTGLLFLFGSCWGWADGPSMAKVNDVLDGQTIVYQQDDAGLLVNTTNNFPQLYPLDSSDSNLTVGSPVTFPTVSGIGYTHHSIVTSTASGRMYANGNDVTVTVAAGGFEPGWSYSMWDPVTGVQNNYVLTSDLESNAGIVDSKVVMGNFSGNLLSDALVFVESNFTSYALWGMSIVAAQNVNTTDSPLIQGPQYSRDATNLSLLPLVSSIVAGDFDNDGVDEIAAFMSDGQTIQIYKVNPKSLQITPERSFKLNTSLSPATLVAGRFTTNTHVDLVVVGQRPNSSNIRVYYIDPRDTTFSPVRTNIAPTNSYYSSTPIAGVLAQAAPIYNWSSNSLQQLVIGLQYVQGVPSGNNSWDGGFVWIGTFDSTGAFLLQEAADVLNEGGCLLDMQVGNFNNMSGGSPSPNLQITLLENVGSGSARCIANYDGGYIWVVVDNIAVPANVQANPQVPVLNPANWLSQASSIEPDIGPYDDLRGEGVFLTEGDFQGRSLRLGPPEKVRITSHIQPDLVLGMPPMHVDWISPYSVSSSNCEPNTQGPSSNAPCVLNLTVKAYGVNVNQTSAFASSYLFNNQSSVSRTTQSSTSWGLSQKVSTSVTAKFEVPLEFSAKTNITASISNAYQNVRSKYQSQYSTKTETLTAQTVFDDYLFFTSENQNIFNYPVLGLTSKGNQVYMTFSVPSSVVHSQGPAQTQEWYQPPQEPGNVLSYPWSSPQLSLPWNPTQAANMGILKAANSNCTTVGSAAASTTVGWTSGKSETGTAGWSDAFSANLDVSGSVTIGGTILGTGASVKIKNSYDIGGSASWSSLNQHSSSTSSGDAIQLLVPPFDTQVSNNAGYAFQNYVYGVPNPLQGSSAPDIQPDGTYQGPIVPSGLNITTTGPLFVGFLANPINAGPGIVCEQPGQNWWPNAYSLPDVGFNHPTRWDVNSDSAVSFNNFTTPSATAPILDQSFYQMKGFFITQVPQAGDPPNSGNTLREATAGETIQLMARIYNFSMVGTDSIAGSSVHMRFYGQKRCDHVVYPNGTVTDVCPNGAFLIPGPGQGGDVVVGSIPGFNQGATPNWTLASVNFDTTGYDNDHLIFWVVAWIQDANGNVVGEIPGHGVALNTFSGKTFKNITDITLQPYSNNVGMYGTFGAFYVLPASSAAGGSGTSGAESGTTGPLHSISLSVPSKTLLLDQKARVQATFDSGSQSFENSPVVYYDGDPAQGGKVFDTQVIPDLAPNSSDLERVFFRPQSCGEHTLYAVNQAEGFAETTAHISVKVTVDAEALTGQMITYLSSIGLPLYLEHRLAEDLGEAHDYFAAGKTNAGLAKLTAFRASLSLVPRAAGSSLDDRLKTLSGEAASIQGCASTLRERGVNS